MKYIITNIKKYKYIYILALPSTIYVLVFKIIPLYGLQIAFKDFNFREGITRSELVGFKNFTALFSRSEFWQVKRPCHSCITSIFDKVIVKPKCPRNVTAAKKINENRGEMLQCSDISKSVCHFDPFHQRISALNF